MNNPVHSLERTGLEQTNPGQPIASRQALQERRDDSVRSEVLVHPLVSFLSAQASSLKVTKPPTHAK